MWPIILVAVEWVFILAVFFVEISGVAVDKNINTLRVAGYSKAVITFVKYMPQV
jgi:hypothetical protein